MNEVFFQALPTSQGNVKIYKNPSQSEFETVFNKSVELDMRCVLINDEVYVWDAFIATHDDVARFARLTNDRIDFYVSSKQTTAAITPPKKVGLYVVSISGISPIKWSKETMQSLIEHPMVKRMLGVFTSIAKTG